MMSEINLKGNYKKSGIIDTEILEVIAGKLFVYEKDHIKFLFVTPHFWDNMGSAFNNIFSVM